MMDYTELKIDFIDKNKMKTLQDAVDILDIILKRTYETKMSMVNGVYNINLKDSIDVINTILRNSGSVEGVTFTKEDFQK